MEPKNNLNYQIENESLLLGGRISKFSLIVFVIVEFSILLIVFIPMLFFTNLLNSIIVFANLSLLNMGLAINWSLTDLSLYNQIKNLIKYYLDIQEIKSENLIKNNLVYKRKNTVAFIYENKLIIKSFFEITCSGNVQIHSKKIYNDLLTLLQEDNVRFFSIKSKFDVNKNIDQFKELIDNQVNFQNTDVFENNVNKLLFQQLANFTILSESIDDHNINIIEFSREYQISSSNSKIDFSKDYYANILNNFKIEEVAFRSNLNNIQIQELNSSYLDAINEKILLFNNKVIKCKYRNVIFEDQENSNYYQYIKISHLNPLLNEFYLFDLFNNQWKYDVSITFTSLNDNDELRIIKSIESTSNQKNYRFKKLHKRSAILKHELTSEILDEQLLEIEQQNIKSKAISIIVKVESSSVKELSKATKQFLLYFKKQRMKFSELKYQQKQALLDFHIGLENKINKKGQERKYRFKKRRFNNVNAFTIWSTAESCALSLPIKESIDIESTGWIYGRDQNWNPVAIDFDIDRPNHHIAIIGQSGSGKTTAAEYLLNQKLTQTDNRKPIVIIIDPKNEYQNIVKDYNGMVFDLAQGFANPFIRNTREITREDKEFIEQFLFNILSPLQLDINTTVVRIKDLIHSSHEWNENVFNFDVLYNLINLSNNMKEKLGQKDFDVLLDYLKQYTSKGSKSELFNGQINLNYSNKIISFNFSQLISNGTNNDTNTLIFCVLQFLNNLMRENDPKFKNKHKYKITFFVDEFHLLVNAENTSIIKQFDTLYALSRSFGVGVITIFQNLQILNNPKISHHSKSIFSNTGYFITFSQQKSQFEELLKLLPEQIEITDMEREELLSGKKHQSLVYFNNNKKFLIWNLGLFYDSNRDEDVDGFKEWRVNEYNKLMLICKDYIEIMKELEQKE